MKKKTCKILICLGLFMMLFTSYGKVFALTNPDYTPEVSVSESALDSKIQSSVLLDTLAGMINAVASLAEYLIGAVFKSLTGENIFPWADRIIFNGIGFLDINFINPSNNSLFVKDGKDSILGEVVKKVYSTIFSLAVLFLGVAVGIMAIRLAISSIASEKARYKQAIVNWLTCIVMLFMMHYILAFVFWVNEEMVRIASGIFLSTINDPKHKINTIDFQKTLNSIVDPETRVKNYISTSFGADSGDTSVLTDNKEITNVLLQNEDYMNNRVQYVEDSGKSWWDSIFQFLSGQGNMVGDIGLPRLSYDVKDAKSIKDLNNSEKATAKKKGYYNVNGHKVFINKEAYVADTVEYKKDLVARLYLKNHSDASSVYKFYKAYPELKIDDEHSPNNWQAWPTQITFTWVADVSNFLAGNNDQTFDQIAANFEISDLEENIGRDSLDTIIEQRLRFDNDVIDASNLSTGGEATDIIASLGSFFKQSAYVYTTEEQTTDDSGKETVVTGWRATKVSVTGALLYAIFIFQSMMYLITYVKRLFYVIMLSMFGPIVVIYDFFIKSAT